MKQGRLFEMLKITAPKRRKSGFDPKWVMEQEMKSEGIKYVAEHRFHAKRRFRFDYAILNKKIAIEYEGISGKSRHTSITGYTRDAEKYNLAVICGWKVLRYTILNYKNLLRDLQQLL